MSNGLVPVVISYSKTLSLSAGNQIMGLTVLFWDPYFLPHWKDYSGTGEVRQNIIVSKGISKKRSQLLELGISKWLLVSTPHGFHDYYNFLIIFLTKNLLYDDANNLLLFTINPSILHHLQSKCSYDSFLKAKSKR